MDDYQKVFLEDTSELLTNLEGTLLQLEDNPADKELAEEAFRVMHTIKGAANMFGFVPIGNLTHQLETIYDHLREHAIPVSEEVLSLTFSSIDHLKRILEDTTLSQKEHQETQERLLERIRQITSELETQLEESTEGNILLPNADKGATFYVALHYQSASSPSQNYQFLIHELQDLGSCQVIYINEEGTPQTELTCWQVVIATAQNAEQIRDVFIFVEDEYRIELEQLAKEDLFRYSTFEDQLKAMAPGPINLVALQEVADRCLLELREEQSRQVSRPDSQHYSQTPPSATFKISSEKVTSLMEWVSELVTMQGMFRSIAERYNIAELSNATEQLEVVSSHLQEMVFSISMVPVGSLLTRFNRLVRDLSQEMGKKINFLSEGAETELDKSMIEQLTDPLLHILRNSIDHGIETLAEREQAGKSPEGRILLKAFYTGNKILIQIIDDGKGIDASKVRQKALEKGLIQAGEKLSEQEIIQLIFAPGFSTAATISDISGRGVGMDVVKKRVQSLRGEVMVETKLGHGTTITIELPLTLSIVEGLLVRIDKQHLVIPLDAIYHCYKVPYSKLHRTGRFNTSLVIEDEQLSCLDLRQHFNVKSAPPDQVVIVSVLHQKENKGLAVDAVVGHQQFVLKPLGDFYSQQEFLSGATILGDGTLALVLDPEQLIERFAHQASNQEI